MQQIVDFVLELDKLKSVLRKVRPIGAGRYENSAEHTWHITLFALALAPYAEPAVDINHVVKMLLVHDVGEIDGGDTMFFVEGGWEQQKAAELAGIRRVFGLLPSAEGERFVALWQEFEAAETPAARFANAADRAVPVLLNLANGGGSWREHNISYERVVSRVGPPIEHGCPALWMYLRQRLAEAHAQGVFPEPLQQQERAR